MSAEEAEFHNLSGEDLYLELRSDAGAEIQLVKLPRDRRRTVDLGSHTVFLRAYTLSAGHFNLFFQQLVKGGRKMKFTTEHKTYSIGEFAAFLFQHSMHPAPAPAPKTEGHWQGKDSKPKKNPL